MPDSWPCVTCPMRNFGFCAAVLGKPSEDTCLLEQPAWQRYRTLRPGEAVVTRNQISEEVFVLCDGWAFRHFRLPDGPRQILRFLLAGNLFSAVMVFEERSHFSVEALTAIRVSGFRRSEIRARLATNPKISEALSQSCVAETNDTDELLAALGHRSAEQRIAYLFLHLAQRIASRNVIRDHRYPFPLRQQHVAETVGVTPAHVSRVIGVFRDRGLIDWSEGVLQILNLPELERIGLLQQP